MTNILLYIGPLEIHSGGVSNIYLFFSLCKKIGISIFLCPLLHNVNSLKWNTPFYNKRIEEITQEVIEKFISDFNAGTLELDPTLYSFTSEEEE